MHRSGKNICINKNGVISLIDFDIAVINNNYKSNKIKKLAEKDNNNYYIKLKTRLIKIITKLVVNYK